MANRSRSPSLSRSLTNVDEVNPSRGRPKTRPQPTKSKTTKTAGPPISDRAALRRDRALEKAFTKAQKQVQANRPISPASSTGSAAHQVRVTAQIHQWSPNASPDKGEEAVLSASDQENHSDSQSRAARRSRPSATYTPTAAGMRQGEPSVSLSKEVQDLIARSISQSVDSALMDRGIGPSKQRSNNSGASTQRHVSYHPDSHLSGHRERQHRSSSPSNQSDMSFTAYPDEFGYTFSDDEEGSSEPATTGSLFKYDQFKTLLRKAKAAANLGATASSSTKGSSDPFDPIKQLFTEPVTDQEVLPSPKYFVDLVQKQWSMPGAVPPPSSMDKKLYTVEKHFEDLLAIPKVESPVASLASSSVLPSDSADGLRPEDRRAEMTNRKAHLASAWAIRSSTSAAFFARACLIWIRQIQQRAAPDDARLHQDLLKLISATEYLADSTLASAKFASRALASNIALRRLIWLKHWQADMKAKWKLASAPFTGTDLFGDTLTSALIEDKDKRKVLPQTQRRADRRASNIPYRRSGYRSPDYSFRPSHQPRSFQPTWDRSSDRQSFRDRGRNVQSKRPFRGSGYKPYRRGGK